MVVCVSFALSLFPLDSCFPKQVMDRRSSSASTVPSINDYFEHNMWNPLLELLFFEQATGIFASYLVEIDLAKIALSCHFVLDLLCYKEAVLASARCIWHHCPWCSTFSLAPLPPSRGRAWRVFHVSVPSLAGAIFSRVFPYP